MVGALNAIIVFGGTDCKSAPTVEGDIVWEEDCKSAPAVEGKIGYN